MKNLSFMITKVFYFLLLNDFLVLFGTVCAVLLTEIRNKGKSFERFAEREGIR